MAQTPTDPDQAAIDAENRRKAYWEAVSAAQTAQLAAQQTAAAIELDRGRTAAVKDAANDANAAIGTGYGSTTPPAITMDALRAPTLMMRGESLFASADGVVTELAARKEPILLKGKKVLLIVGTTTLDLNAWLSFDASLTVGSSNLAAAIAQAESVLPAGSVSGLGIGGLTEAGVVLRTLNSVLSYARTEYAFAGEQVDAPSAELTAAMVATLLAGEATVTLPQPPVPPTASDAQPVLDQLRALIRLNEKAKRYLARLGPLEEDAKRKAALQGATNADKDRATDLANASNALTSARQYADAFIASLQVSADGKGGLGPVLQQWRLNKQIEESNYVIAISGVAASSGRSTRSLISSIFGPPIHIAVATSLPYLVFNPKREVVAAGISRTYTGPRRWSKIAGN